MATLSTRASRLEQMAHQPKSDAEELSSQGFSVLLNEALEKVQSTVRTPRTLAQDREAVTKLRAHWAARFGW